MSLCLLGTIVGVHGIRGWVKAKIYSDIENRLSYLEAVLVGRNEKTAKSLDIEDLREDLRPPLVKFAAIDDRSAAEAYVGLNLYITDEQMLPPPDGMHYVHELIGCAIIDGNTGEKRGVIRDVLLLPGNHVYVVDSKGVEVLIPAVPEFIREVDTTNKRIVVVPIEGLFADTDDED